LLSADDLIKLTIDGSDVGAVPTQSTIDTSDRHIPRKTGKHGGDDGVSLMGWKFRIDGR